MLPAEAMPWAAMMRAALRLGVPPEAFWRLSLREWRWLTGEAGERGLERAGFEALMRAFPDDPDTESGHG